MPLLRGRNEKKEKRSLVVFHKVNSNFLKGKEKKVTAQTVGLTFSRIYTRKKKCFFFSFFFEKLHSRARSLSLSHTHTWEYLLDTRKLERTRNKKGEEI